MLHEVVEQGERAGRIVHNLRRFISHRQLQHAPCDLNNLIDSALDLAALRAEKHGVKVVTAYDAELPSIPLDGVLIEQVLVNLITNAIDVLKTHEGKRELHIRTGQKGSDSICVEVEDTGPGIADGNFDQVFEPFFTTKGEGLGMGLAISRSIVQGHHGQLESELGSEGGALFRLTLPVVAEGDFSLDDTALGPVIANFHPLDSDLNST